MSKHFNFIAPKQSGFITWLANLALPFVLRFLHVKRIVIEPEAVQQLEKLQSERVVLCPNHPTNTEPAILFALAAKAKQKFHYICCREAFSYWGGLYGWLIRRFGAYSLVRGALDRQSFQCTRQLLTQPGMKIVVFPEGEVYSQNDSLLPFQSGVIQLCFWGLEDTRKEDVTSNVYILPVAVSYRYLNDMKHAIDRSLQDLEKAVGLEAPSASDALRRLRMLGARILIGLQRSYDVELPEGESLQVQMNAVKEAILSRAAATVGVEPKGTTVVERMRHVINAAHRVTLEQPTSQSSYDRRLWDEHRRHVEPTMQDLDRLANWIAVHDGYVAANPSQERIIQTVRRLEMEVFGQMRCNGPQECRLGVGEVINLGDYWEEYLSDKRTTVARVTDLVEERVQSTLLRLSGSDAISRPQEKLEAGV